VPTSNGRGVQTKHPPSERSEDTPDRRVPDLRSRFAFQNLGLGSKRIPNGKPPLTPTGFVDALDAVYGHWNLGFLSKGFQ